MYTWIYIDSYVLIQKKQAQVCFNKDTFLEILVDAASSPTIFGSPHSTPDQLQ